MVTELTTSESVLEDSIIEGFRARLRGELILPHDPAYNAATQIWNGEYVKRPAMILRAADEFDVIAAVHFARERGLQLAVRSGGHSMTGQSTCNGGIVVDLSGMKSISIDPERRVARVQAGLTWAEYAERAQEYGLATSSGDAGSVGIAGLALGGGIGWMVRKHGLTIDHLLAVELVTADGRLLRVSADERPELFWALRGGGGNFGIATAFEFKLHPAGMVVGGAVLYPIAEAVDILRAYVRYTTQAPDELTTMAMIMQAPPAPFVPAGRQGELSVAILVCYNGDLDEGERVVAPLRSLGTPIADIIGPMPYPALFAMTEEATIKGLHHQVRTMFLDAIDADVVNTIVDFSVRAESTPIPLAQLRVLGGAMARVPAEATAFAHRTKPYMFTIMCSGFDAADLERRRPWLDQFWQAVQPVASGAYANFLADDSAARIREAYAGETYRRLAAVKAEYDPTNFFNLNPNIKPG